MRPPPPPTARGPGEERGAGVDLAVLDREAAEADVVELAAQVPDPLAGGGGGGRRGAGAVAVRVAYAGGGERRGDEGRLLGGG